MNEVDPKEMMLMFDWMLPEEHAIAILKKDHSTVEQLFDRFEKTESAADKEVIIQQALTELKLHAVIEEEIFYPAIRERVGTDLMNEADEEHHVARLLIAELDHDGRDDDHRDAKFTVLAENVRHHIGEEEGSILPKAKDLDIDFVALGQQILARKSELKKNGIPTDAEHAMVSKAGGNIPAAASRRSPTRTGEKRGAESKGNARRLHDAPKQVVAGDKSQR